MMDLSLFVKISVHMVDHCSLSKHTIIVCVGECERKSRPPLMTLVELFCRCFIAGNINKAGDPTEPQSFAVLRGGSPNSGSQELLGDYSYNGQLLVVHFLNHKKLRSFGDDYCVVHLRLQLTRP